MGYIKEPEGIDFIIKSKPLTDKERAAISEFIRQCKEQERKKRVSRSMRLSASRKKATT